MINNKQKKLLVPVFFSTDVNYLPYLSVAIGSLIDHSSKNNTYNIYILTTDVTNKQITPIAENVPFNVNIKLVNVSNVVKEIKEKMVIRDYFTESIYFRLFIPELFPNYDKVIYLDSDITLNADIAELITVDLRDNLLGAALEPTVYTDKVLSYWAKETYDLDENHYFNSGVLIMNTKKLRPLNLKDHFSPWCNKYDAEAIAPDQNYLNCVCKNKVVYLNQTWNALPAGKKFTDEELKLIHYNMFFKPWKYDDVMYENYFWKYAKNCPYYDEIVRRKSLVPANSKEIDLQARAKLNETAMKVAKSEHTYKKDLKKTGQNSGPNFDILSILKSSPIFNW